MLISEDTPLSNHLVTAYQPHAVWIDNTQYTQSIILTPSEIKFWEVTHISQLTAQTVSELIQDNTEVVLIGCGEESKQLSAQQLAFFYEKNIGVEIMTTAAACRTYNLLANEGRLVVAGLIIV